MNHLLASLLVAMLSVCLSPHAYAQDTRDLCAPSSDCEPSDSFLIALLASDADGQFGIDFQQDDPATSDDADSTTNPDPSYPTGSAREDEGCVTPDGECAPGGANIEIDDQNGSPLDASAGPLPTFAVALADTGDDACFDILDFEGLPAGTIVAEVFGPGGTGPVAVRGTNPAFGGGVNAAVLYDSTCPGGCTGGDADLGTPNVDFGGLGRGTGGAADSPFANMLPLGNVLIIAEDLVDLDGDGLVDDPDDQADRTVATELDFRSVGSVTVQEMTIVDIDAVGDPGRVDLFSSAGELLASIALPKTGDNGVAIVPLGSIAGVSRMVVTAHQSAAIDNIVFGRSCSDSDPCTLDRCEVDTCVHETIVGCSACLSDGECDDGNPCTDDVCNAAVGTCEHASNSAPCDDGNFCNGSDSCQSGSCSVHDGDPCVQGERCDEQGLACIVLECTSTDDARCDDGNPCTDDSCDVAAGACVNLPNASPCDDGSFCNGADTCAAGSCSEHAGDPCLGGGTCSSVCDESAETCAAAAETPCETDGNPCTDDVCDGAGFCVHPTNAAPCDDGLFCNGADMCSEGACAAHTGDPCVGGGVCADRCDEAADSCLAPAGTPCPDDGNVCTDDACDGIGGCAHENNTADCDDGDFCNGTDACAQGACSVHSGNPCVGAGEVCDNANFSCSLAECSSPSDPACDDGNPCTDDSCEMTGRTCVHVANLAPCDDGLFCNGADMCSQGLCELHDGDPCGGGGECADLCDEVRDSCFVPVGTACSDDGNVCTDDVCDGAGACSHSPNSAACDDGAFCNGSDTCSQGTCGSHSGDPCERGGQLCDEASDVCLVPECVAGDDPACDDGNVCTDDACDVSTGACLHTPNSAPCDDLLFCNGTDTCSQGACTIHTGDPCSGGSECADQCNEAADGCFVAAGSGCTDDGNGCTDDVCDGAGSCSHPANTAGCDDGVFCNGPDRCAEGGCSVHDGDPCAGNGQLCEESNDSCSVPECIGANDPSCDDGNPCTDDTCDVAGGVCTHTANDASCDDGVFCNGADTCSQGACSVHAGDPCGVGGECADQCNEAADNCFVVSGSPCADDGNPCTDDVCDGAGLCGRQANQSECDDGIFCNGADTCSQGSCSLHAGDPCAGAPECLNVCNEQAGNCFVASGTACTGDGNECTDDICSGAGTCVHPANEASCDDGVFCNGSDHCADGGCTVHAGDPCAGNGELCEESNDSCTVPECISANDPSCDDGNPCTDDSCSVAAGICVHTANSAPCDDGLFCNGSDTCADAQCAVHAGDPCGGGGECSDQCDEAADNCFLAAGSNCTDDGNACTDDVCDGSGACAHPVNAASCDDGIFCNGADSCSDGGCTVHSGDPCAGNGQLCEESNDTCRIPDCVTPTDAACDDGNVCTDDSCSVATGTCVHVPNGGPCDDGVFCNGADTCADGECALHAGDPCTGGAECADQCNENADNCLAPSGTACGDDGNVCTIDVCNASGSCTHPANAGPCDDGLFCNGADACFAGSCSVHAGSPCLAVQSCDETVDVCSIPTTCTSTPRLVVADTVCQVGVPCQVGVRLESGSAIVASAAAQLSTDAPLACTGVCTVGDAAAGGSCFANASLCRFNVADLAPPIAPFADGEVAALEATCSAPGTFVLDLDAVSLGDDKGLPLGGGCGAPGLLTCVGSDVATTCGEQSPTDCDDGDPCTTDACMAGGCVHEPLDCDDGLFCNGLESCGASGCVSAGSPCPGSCDEVDDQCVDVQQCVELTIGGPVQCGVGQSCSVDVAINTGGRSIGSVTATLESGLGISCQDCSVGAAAVNGSCALNPSLCMFQVADTTAPFEAFGDGDLAQLGIACNGTGNGQICVSPVDAFAPDGFGEASLCGTNCMAFECTDSAFVCAPVSRCTDSTTGPRLVAVDTLCSVGEPCTVPVRIESDTHSLGVIAGRIETGDGVSLESLATGACSMEADEAAFEDVPAFSMSAEPGAAFCDGEVLMADVVCETLGKSPVDFADIVMGDDSAPMSLAICGGCTATGSVVCVEDASSIACGDADYDGTVDPTDALTILRYAVGLGDACPPSVCDVELGGDVTACDALTVLRATVGAARLTCGAGAGDGAADVTTTLP